MEIKLSEISRRLFFWYYPVWLLIGFISCIAMHVVNWSSEISFVTQFIGLQVMCITIYLLVITSFHIFKPVKFIYRLIIMIISMLTVIEIFYALDGVIYDHSPVPFYGPLYASVRFLGSIPCGFFVIWFFFIAERSCISEKKLREEESNRLLTEKKVVENHLRLLQAQIEPQFLFNTLTSIVNLRDTDLEKAKSMQMYFIHFLRATLVKTRVSTTTVAQEMELIRAYLDIVKISMGERMDYKLDMDHSATDLPFPSMLIQPIVESVLSQGAESEPEEIKIIIRAEKRADVLHVEIADIGPGFSENRNTAACLSNVSDRVSSLFGDKGQVILEENRPSGLKVIIEVPYV